ncbi:MAG: sulfate adenylyltransferase [Armatimonadetes bacterium]|nr:sulfate adenylyltransferase [Armatimonadota bacterium]
MESHLIAPHGGTLVQRVAAPEAAREWEARAATLPRIILTNREVSDVEMLMMGALSPLTGFMGHTAYRSVLETYHLPDGLPWTVPITLAPREGADDLTEGQDVVLLHEDGRTPLAILHLQEKYPYSKEEEARVVYRTADAAHPGVAAVYEQGEVALAGEITGLRLPPHADFLDYRLTPAQTRAEFARRGWRTVVGFQTRNPVHRAHEYIQKCALEICDGLLLHPLVGATKGDDIPADVRMRCYEVLLENYYPSNRVVLSVNPAAMRYAGPAEAIFHAIVRKNYGCSHFIVGRDHAGVGSYYGTYDAQRFFDKFDAQRLGITPLKFEHTFYCRKCAGMASRKTCAHDASEHVSLSGTRVREMLRRGEIPPGEFSRPEVAAVLIAAMRNGNRT